MWMQAGEGIPLPPQGEPYSPGRAFPSAAVFFLFPPTRLKGTHFSKPPFFRMGPFLCGCLFLRGGVFVEGPVNVVGSHLLYS